MSLRVKPEANLNAPVQIPPQRGLSLGSSRGLSRRRVLGMLAGVALPIRVPELAAAPFGARPAFRLSREDSRFLDELERAGALFFWENGHPETGLIKDRSRAGGPDPRRIASIAATGFGLSALCVADVRGYLPRGAVRDRVRVTLEYLLNRLPHERGFHFHFIDWATGERAWRSEISSIDTSILLCGVLTARRHFRDATIRELASRIYARVDWPWMLNGGTTFSHGWKPESGFLRNRWDEYCELMMITLLALGSPTHPAAPETWQAWKRPWFEYAGHRYINPRAPLFIHQYSHAWFDFRGRRDAHADYYENSVTATRAHLRFCHDLKPRFPHFSDDLWGITASDGEKGYFAWGGPPEQGPLDGTVVPCAAGGSLPFCPAECLRTLRAMKRVHGSRIWSRYGFIDAFNPQTGWRGPDVIGIDVGITLLMAENLRTGFVWKTFMKNPEMRQAMQRAGFERI